MRNRFIIVRVLPLLLAFAAAVSCVHEWPEPEPTDLVLNLVFDRELPQGPVMDMTTKSNNPDNYDIRYIIEVYAQLYDGVYDETAPYAKYTLSKADITNIDTTLVLHEIMEGKYLFRVWADYVDNGSLEDKYYNASNFRYIKLLGRDENKPHVGNTDYRDAFMGTKEVEVIKYGGNKPPVSATIDMHRPLSKVVFITNDFKNWTTKVLVNMLESLLQGSKAGEEIDITSIPTDVNLDDYIVKIHYPLYMPNAFNMVEDGIPWSDQGVTFESKLIQLNEEEASLGFDYVFARAEDPKVDMAVSLHTKDGVEIARSNTITVELERGKVTTVKGSFLLEKSDGGVSINPDFDGEFNIEI